MIAPDEPKARRAAPANSESGWIRRARHAAAGLLLFHGVLAGDCGRALLNLLDLLDHGTDEQSDGVAVARAYARLFTLLAAAACGLSPREGAQGYDEGGEDLVPSGEENAWRAYIMTRILEDENPFTLAAQSMAAAALPPSLREAAAHDLRLLQDLADLDSAALAAAVGRVSTALQSAPVAWAHLRRPRSAAGGSSRTARADAAARLASCADWSAWVDDLASHVARQGSGALAGHSALRWESRAERHGGLVPIITPDPITPADLIGYEEQRGALAQNTERLLAGLPANDVLLFGSRGTGKSSSVKALLPAYASRGLHLVEVQRDALGDIADVCAALRGRPGSYILFIDDLSFEENETDYKDLKAVLEGRLEARPSNVRIYATSNRRHLVRERFGDRVRPGAESEAEVRAGDTAQEKLSLADRFGIVLVYTTPDQERYLHIVEGIAQRRGLTMPRDELRARALRWAEWHNGRSGRTARQFVDSITGGEV